MASSNAMDRLTERAVAELSQQLGIPSDQITAVSVKAVEWPDASLGCPQPGMMYAQVITPGYQIDLEAQGKQYSFHASADPEGPLIRCDQ